LVEVAVGNYSAMGTVEQDDPPEVGRPVLEMNKEAFEEARRALHPYCARRSIWTLAGRRVRPHKDD
jgi:hypothetical protein